MQRLVLGERSFDGGFSCRRRLSYGLLPADVVHARSTTIALLCMLTLCACGSSADVPSVSAQAGPDSGTTAMPAQAATSSAAMAAPAPTTGNAELMPLNETDVQLYLSVMREAATLVRHPSANDIAARKREKALETTSAAQQTAMDTANRNEQAAMQTVMAAVQRGDMDAAKAAQQSAANALKAVSANVQQPTAAENVENMRVMQIDDGTGDAFVAEQRHIDSGHWDNLVNAVETAIPDPGAAVGSGDPLEHPYVPNARDLEVAAVTESNRKTLAPYRSEILTLLAAVRHPHSNP